MKSNTPPPHSVAAVQEEEARDPARGREQWSVDTARRGSGGGGVCDQGHWSPPTDEGWAEVRR